MLCSFIVVGCSSPPQVDENAERRAAFAALDFQSFDQTLDGGWRTLGTAEKYSDAAQAIEWYLVDREGLEAWQRSILHFHAGQMCAFDGRGDAAIAHFEQSFTADEPDDSPVRWNAYVRASIAFLKGDREGLVATRDEIAAGPSTNGRIPNLDVVDRFITGFGGSYADAYRGNSGR